MRCEIEASRNRQHRFGEIERCPFQDLAGDRIVERGRLDDQFPETRDVIGMRGLRVYEARHVLRLHGVLIEKKIGDSGGWPAPVERAHHGGQALPGDGEAAPFIADGRSPPADANFHFCLVPAERHRAGSGDDHDSGAESDRSGQRDPRIVVDGEIATGEEDAQRIDHLLPVRGVVRAGDPAVGPDDLAAGDVAGHQSLVDGPFDVARRGLHAHPQMVGRPGDAAAERFTVLIRDESGSFRSAPINPEEHIHGPDYVSGRTALCTEERMGPPILRGRNPGNSKENFQ